jgi:hypothetical protein
MAPLSGAGTAFTRPSAITHTAECVVPKSIPATALHTCVKFSLLLPFLVNLILRCLIKRQLAGLGCRVRIIPRETEKRRRREQQVFLIVPQTSPVGPYDIRFTQALARFLRVCARMHSDATTTELHPYLRCLVHADHGQYRNN